MTGQEARDRVARLFAVRALEEPRLTLCAQYIRPLRSGGFAQTASDVPMQSVYDSTALDRNAKLGSRITGTLCNRGTLWFGMQCRDQGVNADEAVREWMDLAAEELLLAFGQSAFYAEANEVFTDLTGLGTGGLFCDPAPVSKAKFSGLTFRACGVGELAIEEGPSGLVDVVAREFTLSIRAAMRQWPGDLSPDLQRAADTEPERMVKFYHLVEPRPSVRPTQLDEQGRPVPVPSTELPWSSAYVEADSAHLVAEGGYHEMPYAIGRWSRPSGGVYGWGIGHHAIPTVRTLNEAWRLFLEEWPYTIKPPLTVLQNRVVGEVRWVPGGKTYVKDHEAIKSHPPQDHFDVTAAGIKMLQDFLTDMFFTNEFSLRESSRMTTVEVYARLELMQQLMGPNVARIMHEILNRIIERAFGIMLRAGAFSQPPPPRLLAYARDRGMWDIEYQSPLERAQRAPELQAIDRTIQSAGAMITVKPDVVDVVDLDAALRHVADVAGVPAKLLRTPEEIAAIRQQRAKATQEAQALQATNVVADSMGKAAPMVKALQGTGEQGA